jgi:hypothetical protein
MTTLAPPRLQAAVKLLTVLAALLLSAASARAEAQAAGVDVIHYDVRLRPYFLGGSVSGETEITLRSTSDDLREIAFSGNALTIDSASLAGRSVRTELREGAWVFHLPRPLPRGRTAVLKASYHGVPKRGVVFRPRSMHASYWACDWMICARTGPATRPASPCRSSCRRA